MSEAAPQPQKYRLALYGGGIDEIDRFGVRDRIRTGEIEHHTELAYSGSDDWRPAVDYPELQRYFELAAVRPGTASMPMPGVAPKPPRTVLPMSDRVVNGILYPINNGQFLTLICLSVLAILPFIKIFATLAATVIMLDIIRRSADGATKMPLVDTADVWGMVRMYLRVAFVSLVALSPTIFFFIWAVAALFAHRMSWMVAAGGMLVALAFAAVYYPACLATIAVWDNIASAFDPAYIFKVIRIIGADYFIVIGMWFLATTAALWIRLFSPFARIPVAGALMGAFLSYWVLFYVSHLLGYAVYRHAPELGWE